MLLKDFVLKEIRVKLAQEELKPSRFPMGVFDEPSILAGELHTPSKDRMGSDTDIITHLDELIRSSIEGKNDELLERSQMLDAKSAVLQDGQNTVLLRLESLEAAIAGTELGNVTVCPPSLPPKDATNLGFSIDIAEEEEDVEERPSRQGSNSLQLSWGRKSMFEDAHADVMRCISKKSKDSKGLKGYKSHSSDGSADETMGVDETTGTTRTVRRKRSNSITSEVMLLGLSDRPWLHSVLPACLFQSSPFFERQINASSKSGNEPA